MKGWINKLAKETIKPLPRVDINSLTKKVNEFINKKPYGLDDKERGPHFVGGIIEQLMEMGDVEIPDGKLDEVSKKVYNKIMASKESDIEIVSSSDLIVDRAHRSI